MQIQSELTKIAEKYNWNREVLKESWHYKYYWGTGYIPETKLKLIKNCQIIITLSEDYLGPHLKVSTKTELNKQDLEEIMEDVRRISDLRTVLDQG
jgi:hypothetical protein